jgi:hypothetical protein
MLQQTRFETASGTTVQATIESTPGGEWRVRLEHATTTIVYQLRPGARGPAFQFEAAYEDGRLTAASPGDTTQPDWATAVLHEIEHGVAR